MFTVDVKQQCNNKSMKYVVFMEMNILYSANCLQTFITWPTSIVFISRLFTPGCQTNPIIRFNKSVIPILYHSTIKIRNYKCSHSAVFVIKKDASHCRMFWNVSVCCWLYQVLRDPLHGDRRILRCWFGTSGIHWKSYFTVHARFR